MSTNIDIRNIGSAPIRIGLVGVPTDGTVSVDLDDPEVRRTLAQYKGLWTVVPGGGGGSSPIDPYVNVDGDNELAIEVPGAGNGLWLGQDDEVTGVAVGGDSVSIIAESQINFYVADEGGPQQAFEALLSGGDPALGFFGNSPANQPAVPVTLGDVIAGLQALGLFAT